MMTATKAANPTHRPTTISVCDMPEAIIPLVAPRLYLCAGRYGRQALRAESHKWKSPPT